MKRIALLLLLAGCATTPPCPEGEHRWVAADGFTIGTWVLWDPYTYEEVCRDSDWEVLPYTPPTLAETLIQTWLDELETHDISFDEVRRQVRQLHSEGKL